MLLALTVLYFTTIPSVIPYILRDPHVYRYRVLKPTLGHLQVTHLNIEFTAPSILKENSCGPNEECDLLIRFCAGTIFPSRPELNKCDYLYHERSYTVGETDLMLRFEEHWAKHPWNLDVSISTKKRKLVFEVHQSYNRTHAGTGPFTFNMESSAAKVSATLQLKCIANRFSASCDQLCDLTGFDNTRWMCNSRGKRICQYGWAGPDCSNAHCPAGCLMGDCVGPNECNCRIGFSGPQCEQGSFCVPDENETVCSGKGYCVTNAVSIMDRRHNYRKTGKDLNGTCNCYPGYKGHKCEKIMKTYNITGENDYEDNVAELYTPAAVVQKEALHHSFIFLATLLVVMVLGLVTLGYVVVSNKRIQRSITLIEVNKVQEHPTLLNDFLDAHSKHNCSQMEES